MFAVMGIEGLAVMGRGSLAVMEGVSESKIEYQTGRNSQTLSTDLGRGPRNNFN